MSKLTRRHNSRRRKARAVENEDSENQQPEGLKSIVQIESSNAVEAFFIKARDYMGQYSGLSKCILWGSLATIFVLGIFMYVRMLYHDQHSRKFYRQLNSYEAADKISDKEKKNADLKAILVESKKLCNSFIGTKISNQGCLMSAVILLDLKDKKEFKKFITDYADSIGDNGFQFFFHFFAAYANENAFDLEKAKDYYQDLLSELKPIKHQDIAQYHIARIHYYQGNYTQAIKLLDKVIESKKGYKAEAEKYQKLIYFAQARQEPKAEDPKEVSTAKSK